MVYNPLLSLFFFFAQSVTEYFKATFLLVSKNAI